MDKEQVMLAALKRIRVMAAEYGNDTTLPDSVAAMFYDIVEDAGDAIAAVKEKPEEACARLGITDEKTRAFVFEHERKHAEMSEALHMQRITKKEQASDSSDM